jgi:hypothetical protein
MAIREHPLRRAGVPRRGDSRSTSSALIKVSQAARAITRSPIRSASGGCRRVRHASDPEKREAYDAMLPRAPRQGAASASGSSRDARDARPSRSRRRRRRILPHEARRAAARGRPSSSNAATLAVGTRGQRGPVRQGGPVGLAFAIDENIVATTCNGITPIVAAHALLAAAHGAAQVAQIDRSSASASSPPSASAPAATGDRRRTRASAKTVYATKMNPRAS